MGNSRVSRAIYTFCRSVGREKPRIALERRRERRWERGSLAGTRGSGQMKTADQFSRVDAPALLSRPLDPNLVSAALERDFVHLLYKWTGIYPAAPRCD